ncbi:aldo/keto reductase [Micromonospora sp. STR1_7]|uniref:Aldo/keto reductase n=1 Tax=Micromonospora parastrephiae TaxID=2806101 RepID=A0ABS1XNF2_9ACTN|nr:aldo/keto reductase [Micromonospora parastrephiae]MBM0230786.1 aldo/keto reductase [Micromonospora parastrephiae]
MTGRPPHLSALGFGASQGGNLYRVTSDEDFAAAVDAAWDGGIRYFDTAPHYGLGLSERRLGAALRSRPRDEYVVSTKVGRLLVPSPDTAHLRDPEGFEVPADHRRVWDFSRDGVRRSLEASLRRTGLDRIDIVYLHDPDEHWEQAAHEAVPALVDLREQGVIGAIGAGMNQSAMLARFVAETDVDVVMCANRFTLLEQGALVDLLPAARARRVGVVVAGVYNSGLLARDTPPSDAVYDYQQAPAEVIEQARRIARVCQRYGVTLPQAALAFVRRHPAVVSTVVGMRDEAQVTETLRRSDVDVPDQLWTALYDEGLLDVQP